MSKLNIVNELHKQARKNFKRRKVIIKGIDDLWQIDLVEMGAYSNVNNGYRYMLTVIDCFSKYAWARAIKTKTGVEVTKSIESIFKEGRIPKNIQSDDGKEFFNNNFQNLMLKYKINHYSTYSVMKASICERFNRTLKNNMWKMFSYQGSYKWIPILSTILTKYNNTKHRTIKMCPSEVNKNSEQMLLKSVYKSIKSSIKKAKYKVGDSVRISKYKHIFEKGYTPNWTTEVFKIRKIQKTNPITYLLEDYQKSDIKGCFYELELQKTTLPDTYLVEKVLKKKGSLCFVKWLGFDSSHNSWVDKKEII